MTPPLHFHHFRPYTADDLEPCLSIFDSNVPKYFAAKEREDFVRFLYAPNADFFVLTHENKAVACGGCYLRDSTGRLCWGMVHSDFHRKSFGSDLLRFRLNHLFTSMAAEAVKLDTSQHSAPFFSRFGFEIEEIEANAFEHGIDCIKMQLTKQAWAENLASPADNADAA